jgi:hypothetical protein
MLLVPALNVRSARGPAYDSDALAYCRISGATERKAISDFVRGVKNLGLWSNMVCWPLRSTQNAGTGTTAYSLGGLGTFNGTLVNGPAWGSDGVDMGAVDQKITTSFSATQPNTAFVCLSWPFFVGTRTVMDGASARQTIFYSGTTMAAFAGSIVTIQTGLSSGVFLTTQVEFNGANSTESTNNEVKGTYNFGANNLGNLIIGPSTAGQFGAKTAFLAIINQGDVSLLHNLYKATLGTSLGLP